MPPYFIDFYALKSLTGLTDYFIVCCLSIYFLTDFHPTSALLIINIYTLSNKYYIYCIIFIKLVNTRNMCYNFKLEMRRYYQKFKYCCNWFNYFNCFISCFITYYYTFNIIKIMHQKTNGNPLVFLYFKISIITT